MKNIFTLIFSIFSFALIAQATFNDDFEAYPKDGFVAANNNKWSTWTNKPGTTEDAKVSEDFAKSGKQSMKIFSTVAAGGPMDVVLPFGARYTTGNFTYKMSMYVPKDKNAYFNFQGTTTPGGTWSLDANFEGGVVTFSRSNAPLLSAAIPHDKWFDLLIDINLSANIWSVSIDGSCKGAWANGVNAVASLNLYPINASSLYYVDDVNFEYKTTAPVITNDGGVAAITWNAGRLEGNEGTPTVTLTNNGSAVITSAELIFNINGVSKTETISNPINC